MMEEIKREHALHNFSKISEKHLLSAALSVLRQSFAAEWFPPVQVQEFFQLKTGPQTSHLRDRRF
jgi:hypothetical protein